MDDPVSQRADECVALRLEEGNAIVTAYLGGELSGKEHIERVAQILEELPEQEFADDRAELAWRIISGALVLSDDYLLGRRVLYAAFPPATKIRDRDIYRRWLLALGVCEFHASNAGAALKALSASLEVARELRNGRGEASVLANLTLFAAASGRYDDVLRLDEQAALAMEGQSAWPEHLRASGLNRGNAYHRLGRLDDALSAFASSVLFVPAIPNFRQRAALHETLLQVAEIFLYQGKAFHARSVLANLETHFESLEADHRTRRRSAALMAFADGDLRSGVSILEAEVSREERGAQQLKGDNWVSDVLHTLQWAYREMGDSDAAENALKRIGDRMLRSATATVDALREAPTAIVEHLAADAKVREIEQYLMTKRVLPSNATIVELGRTWDYLISLSASATAAEDSTLEHGVRVGALAKRLALLAGESQSSAEAMERAALIHDIGKVSVPQFILAKKEPFSQKEQELYDAHAAVGAQLLERADFEGKRTAVNVALFHHSPFDGLGGKQSPAGTKLPLEARIVSICNAFDALMVGGPRHAAVAPAEALRYLVRRSGRDFDPDLIALFVEMIRALQRDHQDLVSFLSRDAESIQYFVAQRMLRQASSGAGHQARR